MLRPTLSTATATATGVPMPAARTEATTSGQAVPVDDLTTLTSTLTANPDGVRLSGGGTGLLLTLTHEDGHSMALTMSFAPPTPTFPSTPVDRHRRPPHLRHRSTP